MSKEAQKDIGIITNLRRTTNFQADVIRRYAKFMQELEYLEGKPATLDDIHRMAWSVRLEITKMIGDQGKP